VPAADSCQNLYPLCIPCLIITADPNFVKDTAKPGYWHIALEITKFSLYSKLEVNIAFLLRRKNKNKRKDSLDRL